MKRFFLMWGLVIALLLSGCGSSASRVETLKSWSFQYNEGTSDYSLFFRFLYKGIIIKHNKTEPTYTKTSLFLCEKRRFFMARTEKGVVATI
jgi:hypothetical protein